MGKELLVLLEALSLKGALDLTHERSEEGQPGHAVPAQPGRSKQRHVHVPGRVKVTADNQLVCNDRENRWLQ